MRKAFLFAFLVAAASTTFTHAVAGAREADSDALGSASNGLLRSAA